MIRTASPNTSPLDSARSRSRCSPAGAAPVIRKTTVRVAPEGSVSWATAGDADRPAGRSNLTDTLLSASKLDRTLTYTSRSMREPARANECAGDGVTVIPGAATSGEYKSP